MIYLMLANGFEESEALVSWDMLLRAGNEVKLVSITDSLTVQGTHGLETQADMTVIQALALQEKAQAIVLPGGLPGADNLYESGDCRRLIERVYGDGGLMCAICAAPSVYGRMGLLRGVKATCYPSFERFLEGAVFTDERVTLDGRFLTAKAMGCTAEFALEAIRVLNGEQTAERVKNSIFM
ncbi:MAG: DJ-1/PfpI family protein [Ruminococcaceae bacterium]|nr:DJ-1/PfpI family protein [Oscillospiraceae bacterium]